MKPFIKIEDEKLQKVSGRINGAPKTVFEYIWSVR